MRLEIWDLVIFRKGREEGRKEEIIERWYFASYFLGCFWGVYMGWKRRFLGSRKVRNWAGNEGFEGRKRGVLRA